MVCFGDQIPPFQLIVLCGLLIQHSCLVLLANTTELLQFNHELKADEKNG